MTDDNEPDNKHADRALWTFFAAILGLLLIGLFAGSK